MSLLGFLKFALNFLDVFAWRLFALGYPLCASIRAIESNSNWETQKLVTYWISFSLVSLFEHYFVNLLEWIQIWPHIKLMIICSLVIPNFDGAFYVYNHLVRPYLLLDPQVIVDEFNKWRVLLCKKDHFLAEVERYVKENGPEALEKLIDKELKTKKLNVDVEEIKAIAATEKKEVEWIDNKAMEVTEKKEVPAAKRMVLADPSLDETDNRTSATVEIKGPVVVVAASREVPDIPVSKKVQKVWTCPICQVTTASEKTLNLHFQEMTHKATYEELKAKNQPNIVNFGSFLTVLASTTKKPYQPIEEPQKNESTNGLIESTTTNHEEIGKGQPKSVTFSTAKGSDQPKKQFQTNKPNVDPEEFKVIAATEKKEVEWSHYKEPDIVQKDNKIVEVTETKEVPAVKRMILTEPSLDATDNRTSVTMGIKGPDVAVAAAAIELGDIQKVQKEWTCAVCQVTTTSEKDLNMHLRGNRHKASYEALELKAKIQRNIRLKRKIIFTELKKSAFQCNICNVRCSGKVDLASHLQGKKHLEQVQVSYGCGEGKSTWT
ncbi:uncharacterized protein LOC133881017 isoform X2 [Alnus glutinosa]|uniref:uncharacterized protein LOC133881017 isoform X2 n=1 Tax=Alnus glutinosa TaxID=3517 RepID=UPI002D77F6A9|nr:uncharacterized protein LOC133881017 isoform X2 [Alnus glutinosa]